MVFHIHIPNPFVEPSRQFLSAQYLCLATGTVLTYDTLLNLDQQILHFRSTKSTFSKAFLLLSRALPFVAFGVAAQALIVNNTITKCDQLLRAFSWTSYAAWNFAIVLALARTYETCNSKKLFSAFFATAYFAFTAPTAYLNARFVYDTTAPGKLFQNGCAYRPHNRNIWIFGLLSAICATVISVIHFLLRYNSRLSSAKGPESSSPLKGDERNGESGPIDRILDGIHPRNVEEFFGESLFVMSLGLLLFALFAPYLMLSMFLLLLGTLSQILVQRCSFQSAKDEFGFEDGPEKERGAEKDDDYFESWSQ